MVTKRLPKHVSSVMAFTFVLQLALVCLVDVVEIGCTDKPKKLIKMNQFNR